MNDFAHKVQLSVAVITGLPPAVHQHLYDNYQIEIIHLNGGSLTYLSVPLRRKIRRI